MNMDKLDATVKGVIATALVGSFVWSSGISGDVRLNTNDIKHISSAQIEQIEATKELTKAVIDLRVYIASKLKE